MFTSLHVRNFRLFFWGQFVSQIGNWLTLVAQTLLVLKLTGSGVKLGLLSAAQFGPVLLFGAFAGLVADRSDKRKLLLRIQVFAMVQSFCLAALAAMPRPPVMAIYVVAMAGGFATAFDNPARRSFVVEMVPERNITNAVSLNTALMTGARVVGPALAGVLVTMFGFSWAFLLDGLSYFAVLYGYWRMDPTQNRKAVKTPKGKGQVREGIQYARSLPELFVPLMMMAVIGTFSFNFQTVLPLFAIRDLAGKTNTFTLLMSVLSVGSLTAALATARRKTISVRTVCRSGVGLGMAMAVLAVAPNQPAAFAVGGFVGLSSVWFMTSSTAIVQLRADPMMRGRVLSLQTMLLLGTTPIGGPILGYVSQHFGARYGLGVGSVAAMLAGAWGLMNLRRHGQLGLSATAAAKPAPA